MKAPSTLAFVLRWHFVQFIAGIILIVAGVIGFANYAPAPTHADFTVAFDLGIWPSVVSFVIGVFNVWRALNRPGFRGGRLA